MTNATSQIALMAAQPLPDMADDADAPEWIHVLPASKGALETYDGRGPYYVKDPQAIAEASMSEGDIPVDQDHAIGKAAARGDAAPARGWITEMQAREDGVWAKVDWTDEGRELVKSRAYRKISPVIRFLKNGVITRIREVSLVNRPNLRGLHALNQEGSDMLQDKLVELLGLDAGASEEQILTALNSSMSSSGEGDATAAQSALDQVAEIVGLEAGASPDAIVTAAKAAKSGADASADEMTAMQTRLDTLETEGKRTKSEAFVDDAIRRGHAVPASDREEYIAMHMEMPERAEKIINGLPKLGRTHTTTTPPSSSAAGKAGLSAEEAQVVAMMGQDPEEFAKLRDSLGEKEEAL